MKKQLLKSYEEFLAENNLKEFKNIDQVIFSIIELNQIFTIYENLQNKYIYLANYRPAEFWNIYLNEFVEKKLVNFDEFIFDKLQADKNLLLVNEKSSKRRERNKNKNDNGNNIIQQLNNLNYNYAQKLLSTLTDLCSENNINLNKEKKAKIINEIFLISEILEKTSKKYLNSFYINLKNAISASNYLQKKKFEYIINLHFFNNLDNLFKIEIELKKIKENEKQKKQYEKYLETVDNTIIPNINKIIKNKIDFIEKNKNEICFNINKMIDDEIKNIDERIKVAEVNYKEKINNKKNEIEQTINEQEKRRLNLELKSLKNENIINFTFKILYNSIENLIVAFSQEIEKEMNNIFDEIDKMISKETKSFFKVNNLNDLQTNNGSNELLKRNNNFSKDLKTSIKNSIVSFFGSFGRGIFAGLASGLTTGAISGSFIGLPGIIAGAVIGLITGGVTLLIKRMQKGKNYKKFLIGIRSSLVSQIEEKIESIISDMESYNEELNKLLKEKKEIEQNKIKDISFEEFKKEYNKEKEFLKLKLREIIEINDA